MTKANLLKNIKSNYNQLINKRVPLKVLAGLGVASVLGVGIASVAYSLGF